MKRIAIIDDSQIVLNLVSQVLSRAGYDVVTMTEPTRQALVEQGPFQLLLVDVNMPEVLGDDLPQFLRDAWGVGGAILLFSDLPETELERRAQASGADGFICKAWGMEVLVERVEALLPRD